MSLHRLTVLFALLAMIAAAHADQPAQPPADYTVCSDNGVFCADLRVDPGQTTLRDGETVLWTLNGWFSDVHVANDGEHFVSGYYGFTLLERGFTADTVMLTIWRRGTLVRAVAISELIDDYDNLVETVSHYLWGRNEGFDDRGRFIVHTVEDRRIAFDVTTGEVVETWSADYRH